MNRIIECRYEHNVRGGKEFTSWFTYETNIDESLSDKELVKNAKARVKDLDRITKLKHEFRVVQKDS